MVTFARVRILTLAIATIAFFSFGPETRAQAPRGAAPEARPTFAEPGISPDGSEIAFVSGGDIWTVPAAGGEARLLVSHEATESRPLYAPDGRRLAFVSTRTGGGDIEIDAAGKKEGRGAYLCPDPACWEKALKGKQLEHTLRSNLSQDNRERLEASRRQLYKELTSAQGQ